MSGYYVPGAAAAGSAPVAEPRGLAGAPTLPQARFPGTNRRLTTVDLRTFEGRKHEIAQDLLAAADIGFFYIRGHGASSALVL